MEWPKYNPGDHTPIIINSVHPLSPPPSFTRFAGSFARPPRNFPLCCLIGKFRTPTLCPSLPTPYPFLPPRSIISLVPAKHKTGASSCHPCSCQSYQRSSKSRTPFSSINKAYYTASPHQSIATSFACQRFSVWNKIFLSHCHDIYFWVVHVVRIEYRGTGALQNLL
jgi:hypothetical protein